MDKNEVILSHVDNKEFSQKDMLYRIFEKLIQRWELYKVVHNSWFWIAELPSLAIIFFHKFFPTISYNKIIELYLELERDGVLEKCIDEYFFSLSNDIIKDDKEITFYENFKGKNTLNFHIPRITDIKEEFCKSKEEYDKLTFKQSSGEMTIEKKVAYLYSNIRKINNKNKFYFIWNDWVNKPYSPDSFLWWFNCDHKKWVDFMLALFFRVVFPRRKIWNIHEDDAIVEFFLDVIENIIKKEKKLTKKECIYSIKREFDILSFDNLGNTKYLLLLWEELESFHNDLNWKLLIFLFKKYSKYITEYLIIGNGIKKKSKNKKGVEIKNSWK